MTPRTVFAQCMTIYCDKMFISINYKILITCKVLVIAYKVLVKADA